MRDFAEKKRGVIFMKKQQISAHQEEKFKDIEITVKEGVETPLVNSEEKLDGQY